MATQYSDNIVNPERQAFGIATPSVIRKIGLSDLSDALRLGWEDFKAVPSHAVILCVIYPVLGIVLLPRLVSTSSVAAVSAASKPLHGMPYTSCALRLSAPWPDSACSCSPCS